MTCALCRFTGFIILTPRTLLENLGISGDFKRQAQKPVYCCSHMRRCDIFTFSDNRLLWFGVHTQPWHSEEAYTGRVAKSKQASSRTTALCLKILLLLLHFLKFFRLFYTLLTYFFIFFSNTVYFLSSYISALYVFIDKSLFASAGSFKRIS